MPELPEVETTVIKLKSLLKGKRILLARRNLGEGWGWGKILDVERRGKAVLIWLKLGAETPYLLAFHQRMSGKLLVVSRSFQDKYIRKRFQLSNGNDLIFHDVRKFGVVWSGSAEKVLADNYFKTLGPDALTVSFGEFKDLLAPLNLPPVSRRADIKNMITSSPLLLVKEETINEIPSFTRRGKGRLTLKPRRKVGAVKTFLLNQKKIAGVGNIMADEILWYARIHPQRNIFSLLDSEIRILWSSLRSVLEKGIKLGGSTMRDWFHPDGARGGYFEKRRVYGRAGEKCFRCKTKISRIKIGGRSSYFCPACQKLKHS